MTKEIIGEQSTLSKVMDSDQSDSWTYLHFSWDLHYFYHLQNTVFPEGHFPSRKLAGAFGLELMEENNGMTLFFITRLPFNSNLIRFTDLWMALRAGQNILSLPRARDITRLPFFQPAIKSCGLDFQFYKLLVMSEWSNRLQAC